MCLLPSENGQYYFDCIDKILDIYNNYHKVKLTDEFHVKEFESVLETFFYQHNPNNQVELIYS